MPPVTVRSEVLRRLGLTEGLAASQGWAGACHIDRTPDGTTMPLSVSRDYQSSSNRCGIGTFSSPPPHPQTQGEPRGSSPRLRGTACSGLPRLGSVRSVCTHSPLPRNVPSPRAHVGVPSPPRQVNPRSQSRALAFLCETPIPGGGGVIAVGLRIRRRFSAPPGPAFARIWCFGRPCPSRHARPDVPAARDRGLDGEFVALVAIASFDGPIPPPPRPQTTSQGRTPGAECNHPEQHERRAFRRRLRVGGPNPPARAVVR